MKTNRFWSTFMILALICASCSNDEDIADIKVSDLQNTVWQTDWIYDSPILDEDYVDVTKSKQTYYFAKGDTVICETEYSSINSAVGNEKGKYYAYGIYSVKNSQLKIRLFNKLSNETVYTINGNEMVWTHPYVLTKKRLFTSSDKDFVKSKQLYFLPVEQRLKINVETSLRLFQNWQYYSDTKQYHIAFFGFSSISNYDRAYEKGISKITTYITSSSGQIIKKINIYPEPNAKSDEYSSEYFSIYTYSPKTTINMYSVVYDSQTNTTYTTDTKTYSY